MRIPVVCTAVLMAAPPAVAQQAVPQPLVNLYEAGFRPVSIVAVQLSPIPDPPPAHRLSLRSESTPRGIVWSVYPATEPARYLPDGSRIMLVYGDRWCVSGTPCYFLFRVMSLQPVPAEAPMGRLSQKPVPPPLPPVRGGPSPGSVQLGIALPSSTPDNGSLSAQYCRKGSTVSLTGKVLLRNGFNCMRLDVGPLSLPDGRTFTRENGRIVVRKGGTTVTDYDAYSVTILLDPLGTPWALESHGYTF
jgi:hypothetical protein